MFALEFFVILFMIGFNSIFAAYEIALASISLSRLKVFVDQKRPGSAAAIYMKQNLEGSLAGVQLGITLVGAIAAATGGAGAGESIAPYLQSQFQLSPNAAEFLAIALVVLPLTMVTIIFGELIPKVFALRNKEWVCLRLSPGIRWFVSVVWPIVWFLETVVSKFMSWGERRLKSHVETLTKTESAELQELRASVALARTSRLIGAQEEKIILGAAAFSSRPIRDVMLPAQEISMLDINASIADALIAAHLDMHTRFPVTERPHDPQGIVGYVNFKDMVASLHLSLKNPSLRGIMRTIPRLVEDAQIATCLEQLIRQRSHIALIVNSKNEILGMVTLEDMFEELVGDIEDEYDRLPNHLTRTGSGWVAGGGISLTRLQEVTGIVLPTIDTKEPIYSLSDWVSQRLSTSVRGGEVIDLDSLRIVVRKVRRQKVSEAQIEKFESLR